MDLRSRVNRVQSEPTHWMAGPGAPAHCTDSFGRSSLHLREDLIDISGMRASEIHPKAKIFLKHGTRLVVLPILLIPYH